MSTELFNIKLGRNLLTASAVSLLLASPAFAQNQVQQSDSQDPQASTNQPQGSQQQNPEFQTMDQDQDQLLVWREIHVVMDPRILAAGLNQEQIFQQYDNNNDNALDEQEFGDFIAGLQEAESGTNQRTTASASGQTPTAATAEASSDNRQQNTGTNQQRLTDTQEQDSDQTASIDIREGEKIEADREFARTGQDRTQTMTSRSESTNNAFSQENDRASTQNPEDAVIARSFDDEADLSEATNIEAGSSRALDPGELAASDRTRNQNTNEQPDGTAVIVMDGETARTDDNAQATTSTRNQQAANAQASTNQNATESRATTGDAELAEQSQGTAGARAGETNAQASNPGDLRRIYEALEDSPVVNEEGNKIGSISDVVVNNESGDLGLVVTTGGIMGIGATKIVAPVEEVTVTDDNVVWSTPKSKKELKQSQRYNPEDYNQITGRSQAADEARSEGLTQR